MHIVRVTWKPEGTGFHSGFTIRKSDSKLEFHSLEKGMQIAWTVKGPKLCIGRVSEKRHLIACPLNSIVLKWSKCLECSALDTFDPCIRCTGHQCLADSIRRGECESSDYIVYLALFSDGTLKVGVSSKRRPRVRWVEQGADYAGILTEIRDGKVARRIEHDIGKHPAVALAVSGYQKKNSLMTSLHHEAANQIVADFLGSLPDDSQFKEVELEDLTTHYSLGELDADPLPWPEGTQSVVDQQLLGDVMGMKGALLVTGIGHAYRVISLKKLIGYTIEEGINTHINSQSGLLDFIE